jgi:hypothetical protein
MSLSIFCLLFSSIFLISNVREREREREIGVVVVVVVMKG